MAATPAKHGAVTIGEAARRIGLTPRAIRYYERIGLTEVASRSSRNYRLYSDEALRELRAIAACRALGMSLLEIRALRSGAPLGTREGRKRALLREQLSRTEARIRELLAARRELRRQLGATPCRPEPGPARQPSVHAKNLAAQRVHADRFECSVASGTRGVAAVRRHRRRK